MTATTIAAIFFLLKRQEVLPRYRTAITLLGMVSVAATCNYVRLLLSWRETFQVVNGAVVQTGVPYDDIYRYADWLLTVPMLLIALVLVLDLPLRQARMRSIILGSLAVEMIVLGYPGQIATTMTTKWAWWIASMVPFFIIIQQLYGSMSAAIRAQPVEAKRLISIARLVTVVTWSFYPILYLIPTIFPAGSSAIVATQIGYAAADTVAKAVYGLFICWIAQSKSVNAEAAAATDAAFTAAALAART
ncbi:MAG TPA: bacteriorhodopsin [Acetobacteraceae bacterium]